MSKPINICWLRRDLRIDDNTALFNSLNTSNPVLIIFIFDDNILQELDANDPRVNFIYDSLEKIDRRLKKHQSSLLVLKGNPIKVWNGLSQTYTIESVFYNNDYEPYALNRDEMVSRLLQKKGIRCIGCKDQVLFEKSDITKDNGKPYTVFTPYKNKWFQRFNKHNPPVLPFNPNNLIQLQTTFPSKEDLGIEPTHITVKPFDLGHLDHYPSVRNIPSLNQTSHLSPHLRFGTIGIRQIIHQLQPNHEAFLNELVWREFFMQILFHFPHVVNACFKPAYNHIAWRNDIKDFESWCNGNTGYPLVDAGMRELKETGYMHNRVRMVVASFLCKHLLIDWKWGEAYFAKKLLDYDLSANNGNWQWAAGTGCDAAPYFRIFNPIEQQKKFDPEFIYIKKWIPEFGTGKYPRQIIDHSFARTRALQTYKAGLNSYS